MPVPQTCQSLPNKNLYKQRDSAAMSDTGYRPIFLWNFVCIEAAFSSTFQKETSNVSIRFDVRLHCEQVSMNSIGKFSVRFSASVKYKHFNAVDRGQKGKLIY